MNFSRFKNLIVFLCFVIIISNLSARELMHYYHGDYNEVVRLVFVFRTNVQYNTMFDTDNRVINLTVNNASLNAGILRQKFEPQQLIDEINFEVSGNNIRITIRTNVTYFAETFVHRERRPENDVFKIVIDVYRQRQPGTMAQAQQYLTFYDTVGFTDRATALRRRINSGAFGGTGSNTITGTTHPDVTPTVLTAPQPTQPVTPFIPPAQTTSIPPMPDQRFLSNDPLLYIKPDDIHLNDVQRNWVNEAFQVYNNFVNIYRVIDEAEKTLRLYEEQRTVNVTFINSMSQTYNSLSAANIQINEIRLHFMNLNQRRNFQSNPTIEYTATMVAHVTRMLDTLQGVVNRLQMEFDVRINR